MPDTSDKQAVLELVQNLPDDVSIETIMTELLFRQKVDRGLRQLDEGDVVSHEEVRARMQRWVK